MSDFDENDFLPSDILCPEEVPDCFGCGHCQQCREEALLYDDEDEDEA